MITLIPGWLRRSESPLLKRSLLLIRRRRPITFLALCGTMRRHNGAAKFYVSLLLIAERRSYPRIVGRK
jgi:hypothetical protein